MHRGLDCRKYFCMGDDICPACADFGDGGAVWEEAASGRKEEIRLLGCSVGCVGCATRFFLFTWRFVDRLVQCGKYSAGVYVSPALYGSQLGQDYCIYCRIGSDCTMYQSEKRVVYDACEYADDARE